MSDVITKLERWLRKNHPAALDSLNPGLSDADITELEERMRVKLPDGMRALYRWRDGMASECFEAVMHNRHLMSLEDAANVREMMAGFVDDGTFERRDWWHKPWVPFLDNGACSYLCWDPGGSFPDKGGRPGQVLEFWNRDTDRTIIAPDFDAWLTAWVDSLEAGFWEYDERFGNVEDRQGLTEFMAERFPGHPILAVERE